MAYLQDYDFASYILRLFANELGCSRNNKQKNAALDQHQNDP